MTDQQEMLLRSQVIDTALAMSESGLSPGRSGNVSARLGTHIFITPSGMAYGDLLPEDIVVLDLEGRVIEGKWLPSSEWHFHVAIYAARPEINAVVHTHSVFKSDNIHPRFRKFNK